MAKQSPEDNAGLLIFLVLLFVVGGYLAAWWTKQKILFNQNMFFISFWVGVILLIGSVVFFILFLIKEKENYDWYGSEEFFNKATLGWIALICFILMIFSFTIMANKYEKGFSEQALENLAKAEEKLSEFNYIKSVLTGEEIERLMIESFDSAMEDICNAHQTYECNQIRASYEGVKDIFEAKQKADNIAKFWGLIKK